MLMRRVMLNLWQCTEYIVLERESDVNVEVIVSSSEDTVWVYGGWTIPLLFFPYMQDLTIAKAVSVAMVVRNSKAASTGWVSGCMDEWVSVWVSEWVSGWVCEWLGGWVHGRVSEWMCEWVSKAHEAWIVNKHCSHYRFVLLGLFLSRWVYNFSKCLSCTYGRKTTHTPPHVVYSHHEHAFSNHSMCVACDLT